MARGCCETCFCFRSVQSAIVAIGMLTGGCSLTQILVTIAVFTGSEKVDVTPNTDDAITYRLYIALSCFDFIMVIVSFILVYGSERSSKGISRCSTLPWLILLPFYFIYETAINIYYFYHQLNAGNRYRMPLDGGYPVGFAVVPLVFWISKAILLFISFVYLIIRLQNTQSSPKARYVRQVESFQGYDSAPTFPHPSPRMSLPPAPSIPKPSMPQCSGCSGGCSTDRCGKCNLPQPLYGYAGMQTGNVGMTSAASQPKNWSMGNTGNISAALPSNNWGSGNMGSAAGGSNFSAMQPKSWMMGNTGNGGGCGSSNGCSTGNTGAVQSKGWTTSIFNTGN